MLFDRLSANWKLAATSNRFLLVSNLILSLAIIGLVPLAVYNRERVTVTPPTIDKPYTVGWNSATIDYYKSMALYFSGVIGMTGPKNLAYVQNVIERFMAPEIAQGVKTKLNVTSQTYEFRNSTSSAWFEARDVAWEDQTRKVFVIGHLHTLTANKQETVQPVVYEYVIDIVEGQPLISHFDSYLGDIPHNLAYFSDKNRVAVDEKRRDEARRQTLSNMGMEDPGPAGAVAAPAQGAR